MKRLVTKGGPGKRKISFETKEILLYSKLPHEELKDTPGTGLSQTDIENILYKNIQLDEDLVEIPGKDTGRRSIHATTIKKIINNGLVSGRIFHRDRTRTESARGGYYYKTDKADKWFKLQIKIRRLSIPDKSI